MSVPRNNDLPQHNYGSGAHYGELPLAALPSGSTTGDIFYYSGSGWIVTQLSGVETGAGGGAPTGVDYLVGTADGTLTNEIVVGTTPSGELGGTWASPTVDTTHAGSAHTDFIAKAIVDAKGDLIVGSGSDVPVRFGSGSHGQILSVNSGSATGLSWIANSGGAHDLDSHTDVTIGTPADGQVLTYDSGTSQWVNENSASGFSNPMTTAGDIIKGGTGGAAERLAIGSALQHLRVNAGGTALEYADPPAGGGSAWTLLVNEAGTSMTNFTSENGTWASDGTIIQQTGTGTFARLRYNTIVPQSALVAQVEVRFPSAGQTAGGVGTGAGLVLLKDNSGVTSAMIVQLVHNGSSITQIGADRSAEAALRYAAISKAFDTWVTLRIVIGGTGFASYWVDGTFIANLGYVGGNYSSIATPDYVGLYCYTAKADYRHFKIWGLTLP